MARVTALVVFFAIVASVKNETVYNEPCMTNRDCNRPFGYICKNNRTCDCDKNYILNGKKSQCIGGVDQRCTYDEHCILGAFCMNQAICKCKEGTPIILEDGLVCAKGNKMKNCIWIGCFLILGILLIK